MAYTINRYNTNILATVDDGTVDNTTDLKFIGKNYAGYGEIQNENFLYLLENFSGANPPPRALSGQVWFDSSGSKLKFYDGSKWRTTGGSEVSATEPTGLTEGDFWWDSANDQLYVYNGTEFILIGPQNAGDGVTAMISETVLDNSTPPVPYNVIKAVVNDDIVYIISTAEFTLGTANLIDGFDRVRNGLTLKNTELAKNGVTDDGNNPNKTFYWGTASNADQLGGIAAEDYLTNLNPIFTSRAQFPDAGITVGDSLDLKIYIDTESTSQTVDNGIIQHDVGTDSIISFKTTNSTGVIKNSFQINSDGAKPPMDVTYNLGTQSLRWANVWADKLKGLADRSVELQYDNNTSLYATGSTNATPNTVAVRDIDGNIAAELFQGTATSAKYADLAEKYTTDQEYPVGTVMSVGGESETRGAKASDIVIGVISEAPAYLMNSECEGQAIGLKGRVPVRVSGPVSKGQALYAWSDGVASTIASTGFVGVALETNSDEGEKLVECVLK